MLCPGCCASSTQGTGAAGLPVGEVGVDRFEFVDEFAEVCFRNKGAPTVTPSIVTNRRGSIKAEFDAALVGLDAKAPTAIELVGALDDLGLGNRADGFEHCITLRFGVAAGCAARKASLTQGEDLRAAQKRPRVEGASSTHCVVRSGVLFPVRAAHAAQQTTSTR